MDAIDKSPSTSFANEQPSGLSFGFVQGVATFCYRRPRRNHPRSITLLCPAPTEIRLGFSSVAILLSLCIPGIGWTSTIYHARRSNDLVPTGETVFGIPFNMIVLDQDRQTADIVCSDVLPEALSRALTEAMARQLEQPALSEETWDRLKLVYKSESPDTIAHNAVFRYAREALNVQRETAPSFVSSIPARHIRILPAEDLLPTSKALHR